MDLANVVHIGELLTIYESLLAERPRECMRLYYHEDWTLAEIAAELGISRQAVHDNLQRAVRELSHWEEMLHIEQAGRRRREAAAALLARMSPAERERYAAAIAALAE